MISEAASTRFWTTVATRFLPFADAATPELPLARLLRLALFQLSVGLALVLLNGTLNRVMIVELKVPATLVALMIALPVTVAPLRALIGHRSDHHRSALGWRRVPYIWFGSMLQFGGLAIMPFALLLMSRPADAMLGQAAAVLAFLLTGAGLHTTQTAGLALATDLAPEDSRPRVVALLYVMLLAGMMIAALVIGGLLIDFTPTRLVQLIQGSAALTMVLNIIALWKQEARRSGGTHKDSPRPAFRQVWRSFVNEPLVARQLLAVGLGAAAFSMQDALLEPYGGEIFGLGVGATTGLTGIWAFGTLCAFMLAARMLDAGADPHRVAGLGGVAGAIAFSMVILAAPANSAPLLALGAFAIGFGGGLFSVGTLTAAMALTSGGRSGIALGAWGAVQATAAGIGIALGGAMRDVVSNLALGDAFGHALAWRATGYGAVYITEIILLFTMLVVLGPLVRAREGFGLAAPTGPQRFGLNEFPT